MKGLNQWLALLVGLVLGAGGVWLYVGKPKEVHAYNDRYEDFILCTGHVAVLPNAQTEGVWLLDYRAGKLLGTVIDRNTARIIAWAEVDLVGEFGIQPKQNVHFLMTTGIVTNGQSALYLAETTTGKFGVYTMGPRLDSRPGVIIRRHDMVLFRQPAQQAP